MKARTTRKIAILLTLSLFVLIGFAQIPQGFSYQAVVRDGNGAPIAKKYIGVRITLENALEVPYYSETQRPESDNLGVISVVIGKGTKVGVNTFASIPWKNADVYVKVELDPSGGIDYKPIGEHTPLQSVPYALYANPKEIISDSNANPDDPIFEVKNKEGKVVFGVYQGGVRVYVDDTSIKSAKGGFAVGGLSGSTKTGSTFLSITPDSTRIYIDDSNTPKSAKGGFAVGGLSGSTKGNADFFNVSAATSANVIKNESRIMWYPKRSAFLAGEISVLHADSVGLYSMSLGYRNIAHGSYSQAMGYQSVARGDNSTAIGYEAIAAGINSFSFGNGSKALGIGSFAFGAKGVDANGIVQTTANTEATGKYSFAFGLGSKAKGLGSFVLGVNCEAGEKFAFASGFNSKASGLNSVAMGVGNVSLGEGSFTLGSGNEAAEMYAFALGSNNHANGVASFALGQGNTAGGYGSIVGGYQNTASGQWSFAVGNGNFATGDGSITLGTGNNSGNLNSAAFGSSNTSSGQNSFAIGSSTVASGGNSFTMGNGAQATANNAVAMGFGAKATGNNSIAAGFNTTAEAFASIVIGRFNSLVTDPDPNNWKTTDPLFVAGNGSGVGNRTNAMVLYKNGNLSISGALDLPVKTVSASTTLDATNHAVFVNSSGAITITLPLASTCPGRIYVIKKVTTTGGSVSIVRSGADSIEGATSQSISTIWGKMVLQSDGTTNWFIIN